MDVGSVSDKEDDRLTWEGLLEIMKAVKDYSPCTCNPGEYYFCQKHRVMGISIEGQEAVKLFMRGEQEG